MIVVKRRDASGIHPTSRRRPWEVARWGRLLAGCGVMISTILALIHHPAWLTGALFIAVNLVLTSLTDKCPLHDLLVRWGTKEREDLFFPGGEIRMTSSSDKSRRTHDTQASSAEESEGFSYGCNQNRIHSSECAED